MNNASELHISDQFKQTESFVWINKNKQITIDLSFSEQTFIETQNNKLQYKHNNKSTGSITVSHDNL